MARIIGGRANIAIARETTRGEAPSPAVSTYFWLPWTGFTFDDKVEKFVSQEALGVIDDSADTYMVSKWSEGGIEGEVRDKSFGLLLYALFGAISTAANGSAYNHTFTVSQTNQHTSLAIFVLDPNSDYIFELSMLDSMELVIETGKLATYSCNFMARPSQSTSMVAGVNGVPAMTTLGSENKFVATQASVRISPDRGNIGSAPEITLQSIKLTFSKNLMRKHILGSIVPDDIINQTMSVEGTMTMPYDNKVWKDYSLQDTYKCMQVKLENRGVIISAGVNPTILITMPRVSFYDWTPERPKGELYEQTIGFRAHRDLTNNESMVYNVVLTNLTASY